MQIVASLVPGFGSHRIWLWSGFGRFVAIVIHIDLPGNSAETNIIGNHEGIHPVVFRQVWIGFLELLHLLGIENMDLPLELSQAAIWFYQVGYFIFAAHINANEYWVHNFHLPTWRFQASRLRDTHDSRSIRNLAYQNHFRAGQCVSRASPSLLIPNIMNLINFETYYTKRCSNALGYV